MSDQDQQVFRQSDSEDTSSGVTTDSLSVQYPGGVLALDGVSLRIGTGLFGLLGPNGAGKTTLMRTLATLQHPTRGRATVLGFDVERDTKPVRRLLGYLPQDFQTYSQLKAWEVLDYYGILNGMTDRRLRRRRIEDTLEQVGLTEYRSRRAGKLSGGMLQRLGVAQALLGNPRFLILDEPTVGLDPAERVRFRNLLGDLSRDRVVILSTHIVADIGSSCDRLAVLDKGRVRFLGRRQELVHRAQGKVWRLTVDDKEYERLRSEYSVASMVDTPDGLEVRLLSDAPQDDQWKAATPTLEDAYLWLIGSGGGDE
jgi:ABC-type multidrug transport system ATPase subunit